MDYGPLWYTPAVRFCCPSGQGLMLTPLLETGARIGTIKPHAIMGLERTRNRLPSTFIWLKSPVGDSCGFWELCGMTFYFCRKCVTLFTFRYLRGIWVGQDRINVGEAVLESSGDKFNHMYINGRIGDAADA